MAQGVDVKIVLIAGYGPSLLNFRGPLLAEMVRLGHEVTALAPLEETPFQAELEAMHVHFQAIRLHRRGMNPLRDLVTLLDIREKLRHIQPDLVLSYTIKPVIYGSLAARLAQVPSINSLVTGLGSAFFRSGVSGRLVKGLVEGLYRAALRHNRTVIFQNPDDAAFFRREKIVPQTTATLITPGSGVDLARFKPAPLPQKTPTFLLVARLLRAKGVYEFAEAAKRIKKEYPNARFHLVGPLENTPGSDGVREADLHQWREQGLLEWFGLVEDIRPRLAACSVFVLPSYYGEGLPRTLLEAAAMGRPAITTDHPGCREGVVHEQTGLLVPVRDVQGLSAAMKRFIIQPALAQTMGKAAQELARTTFDVRLVNQTILEGLGLC
jgi:glycosyltransferase involved in cell wall biosynthesis